ncbi:hypothetical protein OGAPHI_005898 [Ogataea philodendri]|uniref:MATE efflux family protein n=1 Tax=Ogataea philodendri TaxID=1378263 RepID=A0A9P8NY96_9ASCO|nr:uncharacterized protein OGAPHI_005898 [Ogataea philodendri]KAH3661720.1 hypothetical protein OGAPHI_005898 [Ogataea philodendri]
MSLDETLNAGTPAILSGGGPRRGSITQMGSPVFLKHSGSLCSIHGNETTPLLDPENPRDYSSSNQESYIQTRRASLLSSKFNGFGLTPIKSGDTILEVSTTIKEETLLLFKTSIPLIATFLLQYSLTIASVFSAGSIGSQELAAVSLSNLLANISSYGIIQGIASSLSTLCPQAYGRKDYEAVGLNVLRCYLMLWVMFVPIFIFWYWGSYPLLIRIVPDEHLCELASLYLRRLIYGVPGFMTFEVVKQFLQAQGAFQASTYVLIICAPLNLLLNYILVWDKHIGMGFIGAPTAVVATNWCMALMLVFYAYFVQGPKCFCRLSMQVFTNWKRAIALAAPGVMMIEAEWLAFEILSVASSRFGTASLAAQSVVSTTIVTIYQIPFAISVAASTRVAWFVGSASRNAAKKATTAAFRVAGMFGIFNATILATFRFDIARLFSQDPVVIQLAGKVLILGAIYQVSDVVSCVTGGILRGQGRQYIGGWLNLFSYYCLALPAAFVLAFRFHMELFGLWIGMVIALFFVSCCQSYFVVTSDWDYIIKCSIEDGMAHQSDNTLRPTKSTSSFIDHNLLSPTISVTSN